MIEFRMKNGDIFYSSFPLRKSPTFFTIVLLILAWLANEISLAWIHERVPRESPPLPDLFFSIFPEIDGSIRIAEYSMLILLSNALMVIFLHRHRWHVARRVFFCVSIAYFFRAFAITIFQPPVPSSHTYCAPKSSGGSSIIWQRVTKMFWAAGIEQLRPRELCGDLIVSGHTLTIFMALQSFRQYAPKKLQCLSIIYSFLAHIALIAILLNRKHYTIDVVFGYLVSTRVFTEYHSVAISYHDGNLSRNPLSSFLWTNLIPYLERDVPPPHLFSNQLECPSDCLPLFGRYRGERK
ncbi:hypothetical protein PRIPAC_87770 [Pristionchus pacificus]|uniref:PAP2_C domain-containing protein n=1 Tax=Pristionchus pacificus TaxID=54126 RepID=A0A2A6B416_PRIPA|nr:hypothetical protein PRIPAC_87770 [Pristionchus pacificus]|eukprot:PDM60625.1 hypothetical protein PRIPAC_52087 [Pristionchus pacificus]